MDITSLLTGGGGTAAFGLVAWGAKRMVAVITASHAATARVRIAEIDAEQLTLGILSRRVTELETRDGDCQKRVNELEDRVKSLEQQRDVDIKALSTREAEIGKLHARVVEHEDYIRTLEDDNGKLSQKVADLEAKLCGYTNK